MSDKFAGSTAYSTFTTAVNREAFVVASKPEDIAIVKKICHSLSFILVQDAHGVGSAKRDALHFLVGVVKFESNEALHLVSREFAAHQAVSAHKIIYSETPTPLLPQYLLFATEVGARHVFCGPLRDEDMRKYIKRTALDAQNTGSIEALSEDLEGARVRHDTGGAMRVLDKLATLPKDSEDVLRMSAIAHGMTGKIKKQEFSLKRLLELNPQNLWAANELGRLYLRSGRVAEGIEVLQRLSLFHDLSCERMLTLGDAHLNTGNVQEAQKTFEKGLAFTEGKDDRYKEGLAKVKITLQDPEGALKILGKENFSVDILSYLNMRAIMAVRSGRFDDAMGLYDRAIKGCDPKEKLVLSKLNFNQGLGWVRAGQTAKAEKSFTDSLMLGGREFNRAAKPLEVTKKLIKKAGSLPASKGGPAQPSEFDELDWEKIEV